MMKLIKFCLISISIACVSSCLSKPVHNSIDNFYSTSSMCIDGLLIGMRSSSCDDISVMNEGGYVTYECAGRSGSGYWASNTFLILPANNIINTEPGYISEWFPICADVDVLIFVKEIREQNGNVDDN